MVSITGGTLATNVLTMLGLVDPGGTGNLSDQNACLSELNAMWDAWSVDEDKIFAIASINKQLTTATASYTIGTGGAWSTTAPTRIYKAYITLGSGSASSNRNEIDIVSSDKYYRHNDLTASAAVPDEMYPDFNPDPSTGYMKLYFWPIPTFTGTAPYVELEVGVPFTAWALSTAVSLPYSYQDQIQKVLAYRMLSYFGMSVQPQVAQQIEKEGINAAQRSGAMNAINRMKPMPAAPQAAPQKEA